MKIIGLDGKQHNWIYVGKTCLEESHCSHLHLRARVLIKSMFPMDRIMEEVYLPGSDGLRLDFFLPARILAIEVHGEQHYKFNSFFYSTKIDFIRAQGRDAKKIEWCDINNIRMSELPFNESDEQWKNRILQS